MPDETPLPTVALCRAQDGAVRAVAEAARLLAARIRDARYRPLVVISGLWHRDVAEAKNQFVYPDVEPLLPAQLPLPRARITPSRSTQLRQATFQLRSPSVATTSRVPPRASTSDLVAFWSS